MGTGQARWTQVAERKSGLTLVPSGVAELRQEVQPVAAEARLGHRSPPRTPSSKQQTRETASGSQLSRVQRGLKLHVSGSWLGYWNLK